MGTLNCLKCAQTVEADTFEQADTLIDHAANSRKCSGNQSYMRWNGEILGYKSPTAKQVAQTIIITKKPTKKRG